MKSRSYAYAVTWIVVVAVLVVSIAACRKPAPPPPPPVPTPVPFYPLCLATSPRLNWHGGKAHTLYVRIFQLSSLEAFLAGDPDQLLDPQLRLAGLEAPPLERTLYPGARVTVEVPRHQDALFLAVVAGYYDLAGAAKSHRVLTVTGIGSEQCISFGANAIETHSGPTP